MMPELEAAARSWLADPEMIPGFEMPRYARALARLWHYPSLRGSWGSLVLYRTDVRRFRPTNMVPVCEVKWDRPVDARIVEIPASNPIVAMKPSVTFRQALLPAELLARRYDALQALEFRPFSPSGPGTDGFTRGVEARFGFGSTFISWWGPTPVGLEPLVAWYTETWAEVRRAIEGGSA